MQLIYPGNLPIFFSTLSYYIRIQYTYTVYRKEDTLQKQLLSTSKLIFQLSIKKGVKMKTWGKSLTST